jgi:hypothetical protein
MDAQGSVHDEFNDESMMNRKLRLAFGASSRRGIVSRLRRSVEHPEAFSHQT